MRTHPQSQLAGPLRRRAMRGSRLVCGVALGMLAALAPALTQAAERAIDKEVVVAADVDAVWAAWCARRR